MIKITFAFAVLLGVWSSCRAAETCTGLMTTNDESETTQKKILICQLYESSALLSQLGELVTEGLEGLMAATGLEPDPELTNRVDKRKHEYLRFGKRKHEYLRFGKRKHEYLRFGKRKHEYLRFGKK